MDEAIQRLNQLLKNQSDVEDNLKGTIKNLKKDILTSKQKLNDKLLVILYNLNQNHTLIHNLKCAKKEYEETYKSNFKLLKTFENYVKDYKKIESITIAHINFKKVHDINNKFINMENTMAIINNFDLLHKHRQIFDLEEFKYEIMHYAKEIERESFILVQRKINAIDKAVMEFTIEFLNIGYDFFNKFDIETQKAVEIIILLEEERDETTAMVKKGKNSNDLIANEIFNMNYRYEDRENNNFKNKFELSMIDCVKKRFDKVKKEDSIAELNFVFEDFEIIKELMKNDLSHKKTNKESENSNQNINNKTFDESNNDESAETLNEGIKNSGNEHKNLNFIDNKNKKKNAINWKRIIFAYIEEIKQFLSQIKTSDILFALNFIEKFYLELYSNFKISKENLNDSDLLENKEDYYISEYVKTATSSLGNWIENIINNELDIFYTRESSPILDEDDKYISNNFINFLQLIKQQLEPISFNKKMFLIITKEIVKFASLFSKEIIKAMEKDLIPSCKQKSVPGYEEYVIMMGNSGLKVTQYVSSLPQAQLSEVKDLGNVFISITKKSNFFLSCFVLNTCKPVTDKIFTEEWYNEEITKVVTVTIDDFLIDYKHTMSDFSFITFIYELSSELTKLYLKQLIRNRAKIYEDCGYRLQKDYERFFDLFIKYGEKEEVKSNLEAFEKIIPLLGRCNEEMFIIELKSLLIVYPDIKREYIKCIVNKKNELSDNEKKSLLVKVKECFGEIKNVRKTLFSNLLF